MLTTCKGRRHPYSLWALGCLAMMASLPVQAATVSVTDNAGIPLENAVIEVYYDTSTSAETLTKNIVQRDAAFNPQVTTIPTGSYVAFPNEDTTRHHVFSFSPAKTFNLELFLSETPPPVHFEQAGVVVLGCNIHDQMQAFIVVSDAPYAALTNSAGTLELPELPAGSHRMRVWHSRMDDSQTVWWEGEISDADNTTVALTLNAIPRQPPTLSPLQQRFQNATTHSH
ncbi:Cupredoxin [Halomonas sp. DWK9]|uniref:Cupredoxin n=1 Tax=Halomonadaceae TaxID=28256 RepID=UPI00287F9C67|nr:Cupredoxin [Halomonas sp. DWK9]